MTDLVQQISNACKGIVKFIEYVAQEVRALISRFVRCCIKSSRTLIKVSILATTYATVEQVRQTGWNEISFTLLFFQLTLLLCLSVISRYALGDDIPLPPKRFTRHFQSIVEMKEEDLNEALIYLDRLEDWFEQKGFTNE